MFSRANTRRLAKKEGKGKTMANTMENMMENTKATTMERAGSATLENTASLGNPLGNALGNAGDIAAVGARQNFSEKRVVSQTAGTGLSSVSNIILVGVLLAAGIVLKLFLSAYFTVMKPNFVIAMYCLAILLIRAKPREGLIIGILAGAVCQFFPGTPYINLVSEAVGAVAMVLLLHIPMRVKAFDASPMVCVFLSTLASGFSFVAILYMMFYAGMDIVPTPLALFMGIIFGTAFLNALIVQALYIPLRKALGR